MVNKSKCIELYRRYGSIKCILDYLGIEIEEKDFKQKTCVSRIMINQEGTATVFISPNTNQYHYEFLLAHELGHYVLHYDTDISFNYYYRVYKTKIEREANNFACDILLSDINHEYNIEFIRQEKGIPDKIWYSYLETRNIKNN